MGYSTLSLLLADRKKLPEAEIGPDYFIAAVNDDVRSNVLELVSRMRKRASVEFDLMGRSLSKQMQFASTIGAKKVIVIGPDEIKKGEAKVKDMKTGKESTVKLNSL